MSGFFDFWDKMVADVHSVLDKLLPVVDKAAVVAEGLAPYAKVVGTMTGHPEVAAGAAAAQAIAGAVDTAYQTHEAAGATPQSGVQALATIAGAVAASGVVPPSTAHQITQAVAAVQPLV